LLKALYFSEEIELLSYDPLNICSHLTHFPQVTLKPTIYAVCRYPWPRKNFATLDNKVKILQRTSED